MNPIASQAGLILCIALVPLASAQAQIQPGDILVNGYACPGQNTVQAYRIDGTKVMEVMGGPGECWTGATLLKDGRIATTRSSPQHGINLFDATGRLLESFDVSDVFVPTDIDSFADGTMVVSNLNDGARLYKSFTGQASPDIKHPQMQAAFGLYVDDQEQVWICNLSGPNRGIFRFNRNGSLLSKFTTTFEPADVVVAPDGTLWAADRSGNNAVHLQADGTVLSTFPVALSGVMSGIARMPDGTLVFTAESDARILQYDTAGNLLTTIPLAGITTPLFLDVYNQPWLNLGEGLQSPIAATPLLIGSGTLAPGSPAALHLQALVVNTVSALVIGYQRVDLPNFGGTLVPSPDIIIVLPLGFGLGWTATTASWPGNLPGTEFWFQAWVVDPAAPQGFSVSNALYGREP